MKQCKFMEKTLKCQICDKYTIYWLKYPKIGAINHYNVQFVQFWAHLTIKMVNYGSIMSLKAPKTMSKCAI
jgi:hypothetical protein